MPNWCRNTIMITGKKTNLKKIKSILEEITDSHYFSKRTREQQFHAFYGDSQWYKDFQKQSPERKKQIIENVLRG